MTQREQLLREREHKKSQVDLREGVGVGCMSLSREAHRHCCFLRKLIFKLTSCGSFWKSAVSTRAQEPMPRWTRKLEQREPRSSRCRAAPGRRRGWKEAAVHALPSCIIKFIYTRDVYCVHSHLNRADTSKNCNALALTSHVGQRADEERVVEQAAGDAELRETQRSPLSSLFMFLVPHSVHVLVSALFRFLQSVPRAVLLDADGALID